MNELSRMQYLEAMGIEMFVPRLILPSAKPSSACELPIEIVEANTLSIDAQPTQAVPSASQPQSAPLRVSELITTVPKETTPAPTVDPGITLQQFIATQKTKSLSFSLSVWQLSNGLVFIDSRESKEALPTQALMQNIIHAFEPTLILPKADIIQWPMLHGAPSSDTEEKDAQELTHAFLASRFEQAPPRGIGLLGSMAALMVANQKELEAGSRIPLTTTQCDAVILPSLSDMLKEPRLKRPIWSALYSWFK